MRGRAAAALALGLLAGLATCLAQAPVQAWAQVVEVRASRVDTFQGKAVGEAVNEHLIWRGGLVLTSESADFGGISGLGFTGPDGQVTLLSDRGNFITGRLTYDETGRPAALSPVAIAPIQNSSGRDLPRAAVRDAEALYVIVRNGAPAVVRVGFENLTRVADFAIVDGAPAGAAREVNVPAWLTSARTNQSLESVCVAPPASPIAGSTLLIAENILNRAGQHSATLLGVRDRGSLSLTVNSGVLPTDCAFLPNGDLLVLERGIGFLAFVMALRRIPAADVLPGAVMEGEVILRASGGDIDNMEAMTVHEGPDGETRITLFADNNFNAWERNLLLQFGYR